MPSPVPDRRLKVEMMTPLADDTGLPSRRDVRTGAADPAPPTGMIPVVPLVAKPAGDPFPPRRELRTGRIQVVAPADGQAAGPTKYVRIETPPSTGSSRSAQRPKAPRKSSNTAWMLGTVVVLAVAAGLWFAFLR